LLPIDLYFVPVVHELCNVEPLLLLREKAEIHADLLLGVVEEEWPAYKSFG
jgi:hypothetical protein